MRILRKFSSLYITGDKACNNFALLTPILDFEVRLKNNLLRDSLKHRNIKMNLHKMEQHWNFYKHLDEQRMTLENHRNQIIQRVQGGDTEPRLKIQGKLVKAELKTLKEHLYGVEESMAVQVLSLPNDLHKDTPLDNEKVVFQAHSCPTTFTHSHMELSENFIEYNGFGYFLKKEAALVEYAVLNYISNSLDLFVQMSNPDFTRSVVVEGCTGKLNEVFTLDDDTKGINRLHLTGGPSLYNFMAYFTKHLLLAHQLPLRYFTSGRKYTPTTKDTKSLFNANQETTLDFFVASTDCDKEFQDVLQTIIKLYKPLGHHFRLIYLPATQLKQSESLRLSIQMFSNSLQEYVEVGHCSIYDEFLSKRLLFYYELDKERKFVKIISGSFIRVQPFLGCVLENNIGTDKKLLCNVLKQFIE